MNARKSPLKKADVLRLLEGIDDLYVAKGKRVVHIHLASEELTGGAMLRLLSGPTGNIRAPILKKGRVLIVGFDEGTYKSTFGLS